MFGHTATIDEENGNMLIFGGGYYYEEFAFTLNLTYLMWNRLDVEYKREGHTANLIDRSIYLFGGRCWSDGEHDLHKYDIE